MVRRHSRTQINYTHKRHRRFQPYLHYWFWQCGYRVWFPTESAWIIDSYSNRDKMGPCTPSSHTSSSHTSAFYEFPEFHPAQSRGNSWDIFFFFEAKLSSLFLHPLNPGSWLTWLYKARIPHVNETQLRLGNCNTILSSSVNWQRIKYSHFAFPGAIFQGKRKREK